ncbi:hypothetical protein PIB30_106777 [Stylosanthes scabra]|uniref:Uncharacterized protein n=1 Tax=Stylosanthes scabra TaxID=79078 RepID=A0ABU6XYH6_9FABA|nr:hypothetical protein [Stylosanthes scabra]
MGNAPRQPNFDPHSNTYNPGWKHHPNFEWAGQSNQFQQGNQFQQRSQFNQGSRKFNNNFQQPNPSLVKPKDSKQPSDLELALQKLTLSTTTFIDRTNNFMNETKATLKNQEASIRNLELRSGKKIEKKNEESAEDSSQVQQEKEDVTPPKAAEPIVQKLAEKEAPKQNSAATTVPFPQRLKAEKKDK